MGKAEVGTPKYLANKMKAKGLQKLRWYCQMCQKQCRDENGFKCHTTSEAHQRQLLLFADNSKKYIDSFSSEFSTGFLEILRRRFNTRRVLANKVYQEYIGDKSHIHMNATRWLSLTGFCLYLGKSGKCVVDETEKGWFIQYIDRDIETMLKKDKVKKKEKADRDDEERLLEFIEQQVERGKKEGETSSNSGQQENYSELVRENEDEIIKLDIKMAPPKTETPILLPIKFDFKRPLDVDGGERKEYKKPRNEQPKKMSTLDEIMKTDELRKEKANRKDYWLAEGIVVKLVAKSLGEKYYKQKGVIVKVIDKYQAKVKLIESEEKLKVDQEHLETVIPAIGKEILVLNGGYRGHQAILKKLDEINFCVSIEIASGPLKGRIVDKIKYEDISKIY